MDQTRDLGGQELYRIQQLYAPPEFVKHADHHKLCGSPEELQGKPQMYADPLNKAYPLHTGAATWMSSAFYFDKKAELNPKSHAAIETNLKNAAKFFGILNEVEQIEKLAADYSHDDMSKLPDEDFAVVWNPDVGPVERHWPLTNKLNIKEAAAKLFTDRDQFRYHDRVKVAEKIRLKATEKGASLGEHEDFIDRQAGNGTCACQDVINLLDGRVKAARGHIAEENVKQLEKISQQLKARPDVARHEETLRKLAGIVEEFDREVGIHRNYGDILKRPEDVFFNVTIKAAATVLADNVSMTSGNIYKKADLARVELGQIRDWMGSDLADAVAIGGIDVDHEKLADIAPTLPRPEAELFDRMMADEVDVHPIMKEAAHQAQNLTKEELFALAGPGL